MNVQLQLAGISDIPAISFLARSIWNKHYPPIIGQAQTDFMLANLYSNEALANQMKSGQQFYLIHADAEPIGFLAISTTSNQGFIHKFYILTEKQSVGIGGRALSELLLLNPLVQELRLQVNRQNVQAINFYFKNGFVIEKAADFDIGSGYFMNDFVMLRKLS